MLVKTNPDCSILTVTGWTLVILRNPSKAGFLMMDKERNKTKLFRRWDKLLYGSFDSQKAQTTPKI